MTTYLANNPRFAARAGGVFLVPGPLWNGTAGSGAAAPTLDTSLRGAGWPHTAFAAFDEPMCFLASGTLDITVGAENGDNSWIESVDGFLEGGNGTATKVTRNTRTGSVGFIFSFPYSRFPMDGDANFYAIVNPVNGYRRLMGALPITRMAVASHPQRYISPAGSDTTGDGLTPATAWKTINKATISSPSGAFVDMAAGGYFEDVHTGVLNANARSLVFRPATGVSQAAVIVKMTTRVNTFWQPRCKNVKFQGITVDMAQINQFWGPNAGGYYTFENCIINNSDGLTGGTDNWPGVGDVQIGYMINTEIPQVVFRQNEGQINSFLECTLSNPLTTGASLLRNCRLHTAADINYITGPNPLAVFNSKATQDVTEFEERRHLAHTLTVASVSYTPGTVTNPDGVVVPGKTTITWNEATTFDNVVAGGQPMQNYRFLTGALAGQQFAIYSQNAGGTTVLFGDCTAALVGDSARGYIVWHADSIQIGIQPEIGASVENLFFQNYDSEGLLQVLWQAGSYAGQGTITTIGVDGTCTIAHRLSIGDFVRLNGGPQTLEYRMVIAVPDSTHFTLSDAFPADQTARSWYHGKSVGFALQLTKIVRDPGLGVQHQWQHGQRHCVIRQCTLLGNPLVFRTDALGGFGTDGCVIRDSILQSADGTPFPDYGLTIDTDHFLDAPNHGTNSDQGPATFDADLRVLTGVARTVPSPKLPFNSKGEPLKMDGTDLVGALAG